MNTFRGASSLASLLISAAAVFPAGAGAADLYGAQGYAPMAVTSTAPSFYFRLDGGFAGYDEPAVYQSGVRGTGDTDMDGSWGSAGARVTTSRRTFALTSRWNTALKRMLKPKPAAGL